MATPDFIGKFTANNPGIMTLQGTNQYVVGRDNVVVIDVALSADSENSTPLLATIPTRKPCSRCATS